MKALVKTQRGVGFMKYMDVPEPQLKNGHSVKIRVMSASICGTDIKIEKDIQWTNAPVIVGHEFSGVVTEVGEEVTNVKPGDRVIAETPSQICGNCYFCNSGQSLMCKDRLSIGYGVDGAMGEYIVIRDAVVHKIPDAVSFDEASLCEPLANGVHVCTDRVNIKEGDTVIVIGPGPIGLLCAQVAKSRGAVVTVAGIDQDSFRLDFAKKLGIDYAVNTMKEDLRAHAEKLSKGLGADVVIEASGSAPGVKSGLAALRNGGTMVQIGLTHGDVAIEWEMFPQREITVTGSFGHNWGCWERALKLIELGKVNVKAMISETLPLSQWEKGFEIARGTSAIKVVLHPQE